MLSFYNNIIILQSYVFIGECEICQHVATK